MSSLRLEKIHNIGLFFPSGIPSIEYSFWKALREILDALDFLCESYDVHATGTRAERWKGKPKCLTPDEIEEDLERFSTDGFWLEATGEKVPDHFIRLLPACDEPFLQIGGRDSDCCLVSQHGKAIMGKLASELPIIHGSITNNRYTAWMRENDIKYYESKYGTTECFRLRKWGPPPTDFLVLDTSTNPGRGERVDGSTRFVGADMWFGPTFWAKAACTPEEVRAQPWLKIEETEHYMHINCWPEPFTRPDGEQGELQKKLWRLLFNSDCEWPPNGGVPQPVKVPEPPPKPTVTMKVDFS